ncbi:histone deacetylase rpd3 [Moniliophthora roreri MCA 2997]|uniref:histone deacetylase n=1 Tax=Moniliophthora roreri (strain MCA 2997) TaxID=1381753 RepID=V2WXL0_MONRO|nr:histone deacetylase rpd3 [Moniliophthora roreri MCA 2997]
MSKRKVAYYYDADVGSYTYGIHHPMKPHRIRMAHELIGAYDMFEKMHILRPKHASPEAMTAFHTDEYINFLHKVTPETAQDMTFHGTRFLVGDDNPPFEGVFEFCSISAGGSIDAANRIASGAADIAINWAGGLHHAKKREASGFCYINDIVLGILELLRTYSRVLYIDIDCHHGDGVEEAFYTTDRVMTCSFHKYGEYFPGTGTQEDRGRDKGKGYSINVPLKDGMTDESFKSIFEPIMAKIIEVYRPSAIVLQCGADSLSGDKLGCFNVTMEGHAHCVQFIRQYNIPLILLGGGGYTVKNVARVWTYETACALGIEKEIDPNLPWNEYFEWFGPRYRLEVVASNMEDLNVKDGSIDRIRTTALEQLRELQGAPSVALQDTPRESLGAHLGFGKDDQESRDELDERLAQHARYVYRLQESDTSSSSSSEDDEEIYNSDESGTSRGSRRGLRSQANRPSHVDMTRKRISLLTGQYYDIPIHEEGYDHFEDIGLSGKLAKRRFFQSEATWDDTYRKVLVGKQFFPYANGGTGSVGLGELMERGGRGIEDDVRVDDDWDEMPTDS